MRALLSLIGFGFILSNCSHQSRCIGELIYEDAVIYAGATDYVFRSENEVLISIRIPNEAPEIPGIIELLTRNLDGPAEPNENKIGEQFGLCQEGENFYITER